jgi:hypothetical protein
MGRCHILFKCYHHSKNLAYKFSQNFSFIKFDIYKKTNTHQVYSKKIHGKILYLVTYQCRLDTEYRLSYKFFQNKLLAHCILFYRGRYPSIMFNKARINIFIEILMSYTFLLADWLTVTTLVRLPLRWKYRAN